jgi:hypothetical protein
MNWAAGLFIGFWALYCGTFCCMILYSSIVEEWFCRNRVPEWRERLLLNMNRNRYNIVIDHENDIVSTI